MTERVYSTYIAASRTHVLYIGVTNDLDRRIAEHRQGTVNGFTSQYRCNRLVWFQSFAEPGAAITREKELKGWTRAKKIALIEASNPTWTDLSIAETYRVDMRPQEKTESNAGPSLRSG